MLNTDLKKNLRHYQHKDFALEFSVEGNREYTKISYPVKYGKFSRLHTPDFIFEFNLNHEIRHARSLEKKWPHPQEWLKRSIGNDWIYYSTGGYAGVFEALGEYYLPNLQYTTNSLLGGKPFLEKEIADIVNHWHDMIRDVAANDFPEDVQSWFNKTLSRHPGKLKKKAEMLFKILGSRVSVLPPDARHVDYNVIPLYISDGCLYKCRFCKVKNKKKFTTRSQNQIDTQIEQLKKLYGKDIINYSGLFLGEHDALNAPSDLIIKTAKKAFRAFGFHENFMKTGYLFLFGSVGAILEKDLSFFERLNALPCQTFINTGLESYDEETLKRLGKPLTPDTIKQAFDKIQIINQTFPKIEITSNFVMDECLPDGHYTKMMALIRHSVKSPRPKGTIYLSPLAFGKPSREVLYDFYRFKSQSRFPTFLYLIQRL